MKSKFFVPVLSLLALALVACPSAPDTTPDAFTFNDALDANPNAPIISNEVQVSGTTAPASISVTAGRYSINGGIWNSGASEVAPNAKVKLELQSPAGFLQSSSTELNIGGVKGTFKVSTRTADTTPDAFAFAAVTNSEPNTFNLSNEITLTGFEIPVSIAITNGEYQIDGGAWQTTASTVKPNSKLKLRTLSGTFGTSTTAQVNVGATSAGFAVSTRAADTIPDAFAFATVTNSEPNAVIISNEITVTGLENNYQTDISIVGGEYSLNAGPFSNANGKVKNGDKIKLRLSSDQKFSSTTTTTLSIGSSKGTFGISTREVNTTPNPIVFAKLTQQELNKDIESSVVALTGFDGQLPISISDGKYALSNDGTTFTAFTDQAGLASAGQKIKVLVRSANTNNASNISTLSLGNISAIFEVLTKTIIIDTTPDAFTFGRLDNQEPNKAIDSPIINISGINQNANISVDAVGKYALETSGQFVFTTNNGTIAPNQRVQVQVNSSSLFKTETKTTLTIGGVTSTFFVMTREADQIPDPIVFTTTNNAIPGSNAISNEIVVAGLEANYANTPIGVVGGEYSLNGAAFTSATGKIKNGDKLKLRLAFSNTEFNLSKTATITVGTPNTNSLAASFVATTQTQDTQPDAFDFKDKTGVTKDTVVESDVVTLAGTNSPSSASIASNTFGGEFAFSTDAGTTWSAFTTSANVPAGSQIKLHLHSSSIASTPRSIEINIGGIPDTFTVTTAAPNDSTPDAFAFTALTDAAINSFAESASITPTGFDLAASLIIVGGEYAIQTKGTTTWSAYTNAAGILNPSDSIKLKVPTLGVGTSSTATLSIGGVSGTFKASTVTVMTDTDPDAFAFMPIVGAPTNGFVTSEIILPTGYNAATSISISGADYAVQAVGATTFGAWKNNAGTLNVGEKIQLRVTTAGPGTTSEATLRLGTTVAKFTVTTAGTPPVISTDINFVIPAQLAVAANTVIYSNDVSVDGVPTTGATLSVVGGEVSVNNGPYATTGAINNLDSIKVKLTSNAAADGNATATVTIGGISRNFIVVTAGAGDFTPNNFVIPERAYCEGNALVQSGQDSAAAACDLTKIAPVIVTGINAATPLTAKGAEFKINTGNWQAGTALVQNNDSISFRVKTKPLADDYQYNYVNITLGAFSTNWQVRTRRLSNGLGNYPNVSFMTLNDINNATANQIVESNSLSVAGLETGSQSFVFVIDDGAGTAEYAIDTGTGFGAWTSSAPYTDTNDNARFTPGLVKNGDKIKVRLVASPTPGGVRSLALYVGGKGWEITDRFVVQTRNSHKASNLVFANKIAAINTDVQSDEITLAGLDGSSNASATGGTLFVNGIAQTANASVQNGDKIKVQITTSSEASTAIVRVGESSSSFTVLTSTTVDVLPNAFTIGAALPAPIDSPAESTETTVAGLGIGVFAPLNISGGEYSLNGGAWTNISGTVQNTDKIKVRLPEGIAPGSTEAVVKINIGTLPSVEFKPTAGTFRLKLLGGSLPIRDGLHGSEVRISDGTGPETALGFTVPSTISKISKLRVKLNITHSYRADMRIYLRPPGTGRSALYDWVWADNGTAQLWAGANMDITFDDAATATWRSGDGCGATAGAPGPCSGLVQPKELLNIYNTKAATGKWKVIVGDTAPGDVGQVNSAEMIFTVQ